MVKVHVIGSSDAATFQNAVNNFIEDKDVIEIKYQAVVINNVSCVAVNDRALIIYKEGD